MTQSNNEIVDLQDQMAAWADGHAAPVPSDLTTKVVALKAGRIKQSRRRRVVCGVLLVISSVGLWRLTTLPVSDVGLSPVVDVVVRQSDLPENDIGVAAQDSWQKEAESLLSEMRRLREDMELATEECQTAIALQESTRQLRASRRHRLYEEQASLWLATTFPSDNH